MNFLPFVCHTQRLARCIVLIFVAASFGALGLGQSWVDVTSNVSSENVLVTNGGPLASDGTTVYVNTGTGVAWSSDGGATFTDAADIVGGTWRWVKFVNGELWVGGGTNSQTTSGLWRSSDKGATWTASSVGMPGEVNLTVTEDIAYDADTGTYWAASRFGGAYRSSDGTNWDHVRVGLPVFPFVGYSVGEFVYGEDGIGFVAMIGDGTIVPGGIYRTENNGASWSRLAGVPAGDPGNLVKIGDRLIYTTDGVNILTDGMYYSDDLGDSWTFQDQWLGSSYSIFSDGTYLFAAEGPNLWYSANQGDSWDPLNTDGLAPGWLAVDITRAGDSLYLFAAENGFGKIYRMDLSGVSLEASTQITLDPVGLELLEGNAITLEADAVGTGAVSFQWQKDGVDIPGATSKTLTLDPVAVSDSGAYTLVATANGQSATSQPATVVVRSRSIGAPDPQFSISATISRDVEASVIDGDGNVWFTGQFTTSNNSIIKVNPTDGTILATLGSTAQGKSAALDSNGKVWIGTNNAWLHRISPGPATIDFTVDINLNSGSGRVNEIVPYGSEGKVLIAGLFNKVGGVDTGPIALLNHDGTVDASFDFSKTTLSANEIRSMDVDADGNIFVISGVSSRPVYKLAPDGTFDADWYAGGMRSASQSQIGGDLRAIRVLQDGSMLLGFRNTFGSNSQVITATQNVMHVDADGAWLNDFNVGGTGPAGEVWGIEVAPDGKVVIHGNFNGYVGADSVSGNRNITRLLADGSPDPYWNPGQEGWRGSVYTASIDASGNVFGGTDHVWYNGQIEARILKLAGDLSPIAINANPRSRILDLGETVTFSTTAFGTTALSYQWRKDGVAIPGANSATLELMDISDADDGFYDVVVSNSSGQLISTAARLLTISVPKFVSQPVASAVATGDEINLSVEAIGLGDLTYQWYFEGEAIDGANDASFSIDFASVLDQGRYHVEVTGDTGTSASETVLASVTPFAGSLDLSLNTRAGFNSAIYDIEELEDGSLVVAGAFSQYKGQSKLYIAKLDAFGDLDTDWPLAGSPNIWVRSIDQDADGKLILAGVFNDNGDWEHGIVRMNLDGSIDATFNAEGMGFSNNSGVYQAVVQDDGKILVLVDRAYNANPTYNDEVVADIFRINADGSIDETFNQVDTDIQPLGITLLRSGKIIAYGNFTDVNGESISRIVRLNTNGTVDTSFMLDGYPDQAVNTVDETTDGKVVLGGQFQNIGGKSRRFLALLNSDGSLDEAFDTSNEAASYPGGIVRAVSGLLNGDILVLGDFLSWGGVSVAPYRIATVDRTGARTGFESNSHFGPNSNPGAGAVIKSGPGYAYIAGAFTGYHDNAQQSWRLAKIHLEDMDLVFMEQPEDQFVEAGQTATFSAEVFGTSTVGYQWYKDGQAISGAIGATLEIANAQVSDEGTYTLKVVNASGELTSLAVELVILAEPTLLNGPVGRVANSGTVVSLVADAIGAAPLSVQWFKDGIPIAGATEATLLLQGVLAEDAARYHAVFTNNLGTVSTEPVSLSVQYGVAGVDNAFTPGYFGSPGISFVGKTPDSGYRIAGGFTSSGGLFSYYTGIDDDGSIISGSSLKNNSGLFLGSGGFQRGDFSSDGVLVASSGANLFRVLADGSTDANFDPSGVSFPSFTAPVIKQLPDGSILLGDVDYFVKLNVDGSIDTTFNSGGAGPVGHVNYIAVSDAGKIFIAGAITSYNGVAVNGMALLNADGTLDTGFDSGTGFAGSEFTNPIGMVEFASDGKIYVGGNFATYNGVAVEYLVRIQQDGTLDAGFKPAEFSNVGAFLLNGVIELGDGTILVRGNFNRYGGEVIDYAVALDQSGTKVDHPINSTVNGNINDWLLEDDGSLVMVGSFFSPKNRMARINPTPPDLAIVSQPMVFEVEAGENARFEVAAVGQQDLTFQWKKDGENIQGATNFYLEFEPAMLSDRGEYTVEVSNGVDTVTSSTVTPTIKGFEPTPFSQWMIDQGAVGFDDLSEGDDKDRDGMVNALEYALGYDPLVPNPQDAPEAEFVLGSALGLGNDDLYLVMTLRAKRGLSGVTITPRAATSIEGLETGAANVVTISGPTADGEFDIYEYRSSFGVGDSQDSAFMDIEALVVLE